MTISMRRTVLAAAGVALLALAAVGLIHASASGARSTQATHTAASVVGNDAGNDPALATELDAILAADQTVARPGPGHDGAGAGLLRRLRVGRHLVHATVVLDLPNKGLTTIQLDHGTISAAGATALTIAETGGTTATVTLGDDTRVRRNGEKAKVSDLKTGDEVFVMSRIESGRTVAYLVIVPKP
jgi:hypothetical protein